VHPLHPAAQSALPATREKFQEEHSGGQDHHQGVDAIGPGHDLVGDLGQEVGVVGGHIRLVHVPQIPPLDVGHHPGTQQLFNLAIHGGSQEGAPGKVDDQLVHVDWLAHKGQLADVPILMVPIGQIADQ